jgi:hypothetical protein
MEIRLANSYITQHRIEQPPQADQPPAALDEWEKMNRFIGNINLTDHIWEW